MTGYVSPIAHDYGPVEWHALQQPVVQPFVYGPGHQAAIANDGKTTPEQFRERLEALPEDALDGTLVEAAVGLRLEGERQIEQFGAWNTGARLQLFLRNSSVPFINASVDALPRDGDWLILEESASRFSGEIVNLRLVPGDGPDADRLRYGITRDRAPYGGWFATDEAGTSIGGALLVRTIYERDVNARAILTQSLGNLRDAVRDDLLFSTAWALALAGLVAGAGWLWRARPARGA